ncbi:MAG: hypothetical protein ACKO2Z_02900, partial [Sphaerospermopsis kisseleviana]
KKTLEASIQRAFDFKEIKKVDKQLQDATKRSVEFSKAVPSDKIRKEQGEVKAKIQEFQKKRQELQDRFGSPLPIIERLIKQEEQQLLKIQAGEIKDLPSNLIPAAVKKARERIAQLKKMLEGVKPFDVRPLEDILYTQATNAVKDAVVKFERASSANRVKSNVAQANIYASNKTSQQIAPELSAIQINDLNNQRTLLTQKLTTNRAALDKIAQALATGGGNLTEIQAEYDKLTEDIAKDTESLAQNSMDLAKAQRDMRQTLIDQTKQVAEYYRTSVREAQAVSIEFQKAKVTLQNSNIQNKLRSALIGAGNNIYTQFIESILGLLSKIGEETKRELDFQKQQNDYRNNLEDIRLRSVELQQSLPGKIIPFDSSKIKNFNDQLKVVNTSVVDVNNQTQRVVKSISKDAVNATGSFNNAFQSVGTTIDGVVTKLDSVNFRIQALKKTFENSPNLIGLVSGTNSNSGLTSLNAGAGLNQPTVQQTYSP